MKKPIINIYSPIYRKAFTRYLRYGLPIDIQLKAEERSGTHYIWRTQEDGKVRPSHAANNGKIFAWVNPPPTGSPGDDYGCRCWAEDYQKDETEYAYQTLSTPINDNTPKWIYYDFVLHSLMKSSQNTKTLSIFPIPTGSGDCI